MMSNSNSNSNVATSQQNTSPTNVPEDPVNPASMTALLDAVLNPYMKQIDAFAEGYAKSTNLLAMEYTKSRIDDVLKKYSGDLRRCQYTSSRSLGPCPRFAKEKVGDLWICAGDHLRHAKIKYEKIREAADRKRLQEENIKLLIDVEAAKKAEKVLVSLKRDRADSRSSDSREDKLVSESTDEGDDEVSDDEITETSDVVKTTRGKRGRPKKQRVDEPTDAQS
jgi:hypothetical protein